MAEKTGATKTNSNTFLSLIVHRFEPSTPDGTSQAFVGEDSILMDKGEIVSVDFNYKIDETDARGKSTRDERTMVIKIDLKQVLNNDKSNNTNNYKLLERWKSTRYKDDTITKEKFYKQVCVDCRFGGEHERRIFFKNAYIEKSISRNNTLNGTNHLIITVKQKEDKKTNIIIAPTPTIYTPSESIIKDKRSENKNIRYIGAEYYAVFDKGELDGKVTGILYFGDEIEIDMNFTTEDKFVKIVSPISGFVKRENLVMNKPANDSYSKELYDKVRLSKYIQNIYIMPYEGSDISVREVKVDEEITLKGTHKITSIYGGVEATWIKCKFGDVTGWVDCGKLKGIPNTPIPNNPLDNKTYIWNYLINTGKFTEIQVAAIMGNIEQESGYSPTNAQDSYGYPGLENPEYIEKYDINDGVGWGLIQWTYYTRKDGLQNYAKGKGKSVGDIDTQLEYLLIELKSYSNFFTINDLDDATEYFCVQVERAGTPHMAARKNYAKQVYAQFSSK